MSQLTEEEKRLLQQAMQGVKPLKTSKPVVVQKRESIPQPLKPIYPTEKTNTPLLSFYDPAVHEYPAEIYFFRPGLQYRVQQQLRQGKMIPQASLDLHGMIVDEARDAVAKFLMHAQQSQFRIIKIIHGKGGDRGAILRNRIYQWLPQASFVLAFCTTIARDGGTGAVYVLLKGK